MTNEEYENRINELTEQLAKLKRELDSIYYIADETRGINKERDVFHLNYGKWTVDSTKLYNLFDVAKVLTESINDMKLAEGTPLADMSDALRIAIQECDDSIESEKEPDDE